MKMKKILPVLVVLVVVFFFTGITKNNATTGNFVKSTKLEDRSYYAETVLTLELVNLSIGNYYGLLVGANQNSWDYQWDNFTAREGYITREIVHFNTQTYLDNTSQEIQTLLIILYDIDNDQDTTVTELDSITYHVNTIKQQISPEYWGWRIVAGVGIISFGGIIIAIIKQFF